MGWVAGES